MGFKTKGLQKLLSKNINVHSYTECKNKEDLIDFIEVNRDKTFTIRFDSDEVLNSLPFYVYMEDSYSVEEICDEAERNKPQITRRSREYQ